MERRLVHIKCPCCGNGRSRRIIVERGLSIVKCPQCSLVYVNPRLSHEEIVKIYAKYYNRPGHWESYLRDYGMAEGISAVRPVVRGRELWRGRYEKVWRKLTPHLPAAGNFNALDVGAGTSAWPAFVKEKNANSWAFDIVELPEAAKREESGVTRVIARSLGEARLPEGFFDLITAWDVIEHVEDVDDFLFSIRRLLKPDGVLFIQTPNANWQIFKAAAAKALPLPLLRRLTTSAGIFLPEQHLQTYGISSIQRQLKNNGFNIAGLLNIDWSERKDRYLSRLLYSAVYFQASIAHFLTGGWICTNIAISVLAKKSS